MAIRERAPVARETGVGGIYAASSSTCPITIIVCTHYSDKWNATAKCLCTGPCIVSCSRWRRLATMRTRFLGSIPIVLIVSSKRASLWLRGVIKACRAGDGERPLALDTGSGELQQSAEQRRRLQSGRHARGERSRKMRWLASFPGAPMTQPPGCVPDPHW